jgi:hypothetical protein
MRTMLQTHRDWLTVVQMPSCATDLNPVEGAWPNMKNSLGNLGSCGTPRQLATIMKSRLKRIQNRPALIAGFLPRPASASNPNHRRARPWLFNLCSGQERSANAERCNLCMSEAIDREWVYP